MLIQINVNAKARIKKQIKSNRNLFFKESIAFQLTIAGSSCSCYKTCYNKQGTLCDNSFFSIFL